MVRRRRWISPTRRNDVSEPVAPILDWPERRLVAGWTERILEGTYAPPHYRLRSDIRARRRAPVPLRARRRRGGVLRGDGPGQSRGIGRLRAAARLRDTRVAAALRPHGPGRAPGARGGRLVGHTRGRRGRPGGVRGGMAQVVVSGPDVALRAAQCGVPLTGRVPSLCRVRRAKGVLAVQPDAVSPVSHRVALF